MKILLLSFGFIFFSGCASLMYDPNQELSINTTPIEGASCDISNERGNWHLPKTPGKVFVGRAHGELVVTCKKEDLTGVQRTPSSNTTASVWGNALLGGPIGGAIDIGNGTAYEYPEQITVEIKPASENNKPQAKEDVIDKAKE